MNNVSMSLIFFKVADHQYAIDVSNILSISNYPKELLPLSTCHKSVEGGIHFNDQVLPLLSLRYFLGIKESSVSQKILVLKFGEEVIAVGADSLVDVKTISDNDVSMFDKSHTSYFSLIAGVHVESETQILDMKALFSNKDILKIKVDESAAATKKKIGKSYLKFAIGENDIYVDVANVFKILTQPKKILTSGKSAYIDGKIEYNQEVIALLSKKLVIPNDKDDTPLYERSDFALILHLDEEKVCLPINSFEEFVDYDGPSDFNKEISKSDDIYHVVNHNKEIFTFLDTQKVFEHVEVRFYLDKLRIEHRKNQKDEVSDKALKVGKSLLLFKLKLNFGIDLKLVEEIIDLPDDIIIPPTLHSKFYGLYNLRGKIVHILDTPKYYNIGETDEEKKHKKVIIVVKDGMYVGVLIDQLIGINNTKDVLVMKIPTMLLNQFSKPLSNEISDMFEIENKKIIHIIDNDSFLSNLSLFN